MRNSLTLLAAVAVFLLAIVGGCKSDDPNEDDSSSGSSGTSGNSSSGAPAPACRDLTTGHPEPDCDRCARSRCCSSVVDCDESKDCRALRDCLSPCARGDAKCSDECRTKHSEGGALLAALDDCAAFECPVACGTATVSPDGG